MMRHALFVLAFWLCLCGTGTCKGWKGDWERYIRAPEDKRRIVPREIWKTEGDVEVEIKGGRETVVVRIGEGGWVTWGFGENISGRVCLVVEAVGGGLEEVSLGYSESVVFAGPVPDATTDRRMRDLPLLMGVPAGKGEVVCVGGEFVRGAFGYFTVYVPEGDDDDDDGGRGWFQEVWTRGQKVLGLGGKKEKKKKQITISDVWVNCTSFPSQGNNGKEAYTGYFSSSSDLLNRIWYAGAYTLQLGTIDPREGGALIDYNRIVDHNKSPTGSWYSNFTISDGESVTTDGAKRDRMVWPGDMFIAIPSIAVSTGDYVSIKNALGVIFKNQYFDGRLPYAGPPMGVTDNREFSDTYHLHSLLGVYGYVLWSGDLGYLREIWGQYLFALHHSISIVDDMGLVHVTSTADWLRPGMTGHNLEASALLYTVLSRSGTLAGWLGYDVPPLWGVTQKRLETGFSRLYCPELGLFSDNIGQRSCYPEEGQRYHPILPQDGNSWLLISGADLTPSGHPFKSPKSRFRAPSPLPNGPPTRWQISEGLRKRWVKHGAPCPEFPNTISPFASGFELLGHVYSGEIDTAVELMLLEWGHLVNGDGFNNGSTLAEGFRIDGDIQYPAYPSRARNSLAHGWASGPTWVLTEWVLGIEIKTPGGGEWEVKGTLTKWLGWVRGGVTLGNGGRVEVKVWRVVSKSENEKGVVWEVKADGDTKGAVMGMEIKGGERVVVLVREGEQGERIDLREVKVVGKENEEWYRNTVVGYGEDEWVFDEEWKEPVMEKREQGVVDWEVMEENFRTEVWEGWEAHVGWVREAGDL
ncbi:family 78 putative glycoside hydrolase [Cercophora samala]|uniref:Family 78 putative glycoside hydrolase n=1 Tax=Cercophora samala TaxID=330535 RepID=A0AA40DBR9_9PEZI|nr:family 78 putative glycoside hydrolase [Cercophora samala]